MWVYDLDNYCITEVNNAACLHYGYSESEFLQLTVFNLSPAEDHKELSFKLKQDKTVGQNRVVMRHQDKLGNTFYVHEYSNEINFKGKPYKLVLALDVNDDLVNSEHINVLNKDLKNREQYLSSLINHQTSYLVRLSHSGIIVFANKLFHDDYLKDSPIGQLPLFISLIQPNDRELWFQQVESCLKFPNDRIEFSGWITSCFGNRYVQWQLNKIEAENINQLTEIQLSGIDITEKVGFQKKISDDSIALDAMFDGITDGFFVMTPQGEIIRINEAMVAISGRLKEQLMGTKVQEILPFFNSKEVLTALQSVISKGTTTQLEVLWIAKNSWLNLTFYPINEGITVYAQDITAKKKIELSLLERNHTLQEIAWLQSHKIRRPVSSMLGLIALFNLKQTDAKINEQIIAHLNELVHEIDTMIKEVVDRTQPKEHIEPSESANITIESDDFHIPYKPST